MAYWGGGPIDNDYAFSHVGASVLLLRERLFGAAEGAIAASNSEQAIVAILRCLRSIDEQFPKAARVSFRIEDLDRAEELFAEWYRKAEKKVPVKYRARVKKDADIEFQKFRARFLTE